jgi:hypothetical protein
LAASRFHAAPARLAQRRFTLLIGERLALSVKFHVDSRDARDGILHKEALLVLDLFM